MYIVCGHGSFSNAMKESIEMIVGEVNNFKYIDFKNDMNLQNLVDTFEKCVEKTNEEIVFLCDLDGGTPCNAANYFKLQNNNCRVFSGLNLPMLLSLATGDNVEDSVMIGIDNIREL
ncbi:PTS sugar transporter subunit IIA [Helcococcus kunzii]|uniref:PTS sugar transporter subunit IIA n=1 Tax=Helcococcus kunzii TaxID=40091 RepID=UPI00389BE861